MSIFFSSRPPPRPNGGFSLASIKTAKKQNKTGAPFKKTNTPNSPARRAPIFPRPAAPATPPRALLPGEELRGRVSGHGSQLVPRNVRWVMVAQKEVLETATFDDLEGAPCGMENPARGCVVF